MQKNFIHNRRAILGGIHLLLLLLLGLLLVLRGALSFNEIPFAPSSDLEKFPLYPFIALVLAGWGWTLHKIWNRRWLLMYSSLALSGMTFLLIAESICRLEMPPWPILDLHGVSPDLGPEAWGRIEKLDPQALPHNAWGQRDLERTLSKPPHRTRLAFVGDSFLEDSSILPVSVKVEQAIGPPFEVLNLGVSATSPKEYYWRTKNVALKMGVDHVLLFYYTGNDAMDIYQAPFQRKLFAPPPQSSLLGTLLPGLNYKLTHKSLAPVLGWLRDPPLHVFEESLRSSFESGGLEQFPERLSQHHRGDQKAFCDLLKSRDLSSFYEMVIHPDKGLYRSTWFPAAFAGAINPEYRVPKKSDASLFFTYQWIEATRDRCREQSVDFSVVIIPSGFDVDDRMAEQWKPLADMRKVLMHKQTEAQEIERLCKKGGIPVLNLYPGFKGTKGTYLNMDGHWSDSGNELAAQGIKNHLLSSRRP